MKKLKFFLSLLMATVFSMGTVWATTITVPSTTLDLTDPAMVTTQSWYGATAYYLDSKALIISGYESYKSVTNQTWITYASTGSSNTAWDASAPFKGSSYYTNASYATLQAGRYTAYLITGCDSVWLYGKNNSTSKYLVMNIYDVTSSTPSSIDDASLDATYVLKNTSTTNAMVLKQGLDASKKYLVVTTGVGNSNSRVFEIAFFRPAGSDPAVSGAPASIDFGSVLEGTIGEDDTEHVMQNFTLTGANLTDDVELNIETTGGGSIFFLNGYKSYITLSPEAGAINYAVYVIASTSNVGPFTGTLTISSQASTPDFADIVVPLSINVIEPVTSYEIDFETNALGAYANWNFSNIAIVSTAISAHAGTYYGNTDGKTTASITTKEKIALPGTLTFYISKESTNTSASNWVAQVSEDGSAWTDVETFDAKAMNKGVWNECVADLSDYSNVYVRISYGSSAAIRAIDDISLAMREAAEIEKPTIIGQTPFYKNTHVTINCVTDGAVIYYTLDGSEPDPDEFGGSTNTYDASGINLVNTTTINAIAVKNSDRSEVVSKTFTKVTVMTVAEALATIDGLTEGGKTPDSVYVEGYVKSISEIAAGGYTNATYLIQDQGVDNELTVFRGRNVGNTDFTSSDELAVGDMVVVKGILQKYKKDDVITPEFTQGNYIVERTSNKTSAGLAWEDAEASAYTMGKSNSYQTLTNPNSVVVTYSGDDDAVATVASDGTISLVAPGDVTVTASFAGDASYLPAEVSYTLHVYAPNTLTITGSATQTAYDIGDPFDREGLIATVAYDDGQTWEATAVCLWTVNPLFISNSTNHVDVTAEWQEAGLTSSPFQQDITINTYVITFGTPSNGTLVIKDEYGDPISSGESYAKGTVFTVEATPNSGYQLDAISVVGATLSAGSFTVGTEDISVTATFVPLPSHVYSVVGNAAVIATGWDQTATETEMTLNAGVYSYKVEDVILQAGTPYEYKIVEDHAWTVSYPQDGNASFTVDKDGRYDVTFTLNESTKAYAASPEFIEAIVVNRKFAVQGDFNSWSAAAVEVAPDAETASFVVNFAAAGDYEFKVQVNGAWLSNAYTYHRAYTGASDITEDNSNNMTLHVDLPGEYTFTWTYATNALEITFPALPTYTLTLHIATFPNIGVLEDDLFAAVQFESFDNDPDHDFVMYDNGTLVMSGEFVDGTVVNFENFDSQTYKFVKWSDDESTTFYHGIDIDQNKEVTMYVTPITFDAQIASHDVSKGTVEIVSANPLPMSEILNPSSTWSFTVNAIPAQGYKFLGWGNFELEKAVGENPEYDWYNGAYKTLEEYFAAQHEVYTSMVDLGDALTDPDAIAYRDYLSQVFSVSATFTAQQIAVDYEDITLDLVNEKYTLKAFFTEDSGTAVGNTSDDVQATKVIENNQLVIIKNGTKYNVIGLKLR